MPVRLNRIATLFISVLPAFGVTVQTPHSNFVASFNYACPEFHVPPLVRTKRVATVHAEPHKLDTFVVGVFDQEAPPTRKYEVLGGVEVLAQTKKSDRYELVDKAQEAAAKMGGDALIGVNVQDAGSATPKLGPRGMLVLTAQVVRWE